MAKGILSRVTRFRKSVAMLALALWGLGSMHCDLEQVPGLKFLAWCHPSDPASHQDNGCESDACSEVESGLYRMEEQPATVSVPSLVLGLVLPLWEDAPPTPELHLELVSCSPPELPRVWQFFQRTARQPRAPSS
jgi:hypothetical protein